MVNALDPGMPGPPVDLIEFLTEALRLTCAFDLEFCDRHDRQLSRVAEELDERVRQLQPVWPGSFSDRTPDSPVVNGIRRDLAGALQQVGGDAQELADRLADREPRDRAEDGLPSAIRCQLALVGLWYRLAFRYHQQADAGPVSRQIRDSHLRYLLGEVRGALPAVAPEGIGAPSFLRELRPPGQEDPDPDAYRRLAARISRTWKVAVGKRGPDSDTWTALKRLAEKDRLEPAEAKQRLVEGTLGEVLDDLDRRVEVRVGQQWRKRVTVPIRSTHEGDDSLPASQEWANDFAPKATPAKTTFWIDELPFYRRWKWVANKAIGRAEQHLEIAYGPNEISLSEPDDGPGASPTGQHDDADDAFSVDDTAEIEARLRAEEALEAVAEADLTQRQAEVWLRQADLPPALRLELADGLGINAPDHRQTRQQVADDLGIAPGTVGSHLHRARQKLRPAVGAT